MTDRDERDRLQEEDQEHVWQEPERCERCGKDRITCDGQDGPPDPRRKPVTVKRDPRRMMPL